MAGGRKGWPQADEGEVRSRELWPAGPKDVDRRRSSALRFVKAR